MSTILVFHRFCYGTILTATASYAFARSRLYLELFFKYSATPSSCYSSTVLLFHIPTVVQLVRLVYSLLFPCHSHSHSHSMTS